MLDNLVIKIGEFSRSLDWFLAAVRLFIELLPGLIIWLAPVVIVVWFVSAAFVALRPGGPK